MREALKKSTFKNILMDGWTILVVESLSQLKRRGSFFDNLFTIMKQNN